MQSLNVSPFSSSGSTPAPACSSFNDLIGAGEHRWRNFDTKRLGGLEVDDKLELGRILHRQIGGLLAPKDAIDVARHAPVRIDRIRPVGDQTSGRNKQADRV